MCAAVATLLLLHCDISWLYGWGLILEITDVTRDHKEVFILLSCMFGRLWFLGNTLFEVWLESSILNYCTLRSISHVFFFVGGYLLFCFFIAIQSQNVFGLLGLSSSDTVGQNCTIMKNS